MFAGFVTRMRLPKWVMFGHALGGAGCFEGGGQGKE